MTVEQAYQILYGGALIVFLLMIGAMVVNMLGTMTICSIALLSYLLGEGYLADVALIYAMISFVAVLMMASMFVPSKPKQPELDSIDTEQESSAAESSRSSGAEKKEEDKKR